MSKYSETCDVGARFLSPYTGEYPYLDYLLKEINGIRSLKYLFADYADDQSEKKKL